MKRIIFILGLCLLMGCLLASCGGGHSTTDQTGQASVPADTTIMPSTEEPNRPEALPAEGVLSCERKEDTVCVTVTLASCVNEEVSLLVLSDPSDQYTWSDHPDACLSDIGQLSLDANGEGTLELKIKSDADSVYVLMTASSGSYGTEVN